MQIDIWNKSEMLEFRSKHNFIISLWIWIVDNPRFHSIRVKTMKFLVVVKWSLSLLFSKKPAVLIRNNVSSLFS